MQTLVHKIKALEQSRTPDQHRNRPHLPTTHLLPRRRTGKFRRITVRSLHPCNILLPRSPMQTPGEILQELDAVLCGRIRPVTPFAAADELDLVWSAALLHDRRGRVA